MKRISLISYGEKTQIGAEDMDNKLIPMPEFEPTVPDPEKESLKNFLDSILPPKKVHENGLIFYHFVSCDSAIVNDILKLHKNLQTQMKIRGAKESGICPIREELYNECFEEIIRQVTINCLQRGDLLNRIKLEMNYEINYYRQLYESLIAFSLRKVLQEKKKQIMLENKRDKLNKEIEELEKEINEKNEMLKQRMDEENKREEQAMKDHVQAMKVLKEDNENKSNKAVEILTQPKEENILIK
jgi:dynein light intermediate chain